MEKFFVHILDFIKSLEVKAQEKSQRKKYWVLGNQYLQAVDDVEEERKCLDHDLKKKALCVYQAARCGMKEGVLTGIFLGGFYGLIKNLNENVGNALMPSSLRKVSSSGEGEDQNVTEKNSEVKESDNKNTVQSGNNNNQPQSDFREQTFVRDNAQKNKKRGKSTFTKSEPPDRDSNNELKTERRPSTAGQSANETLFPVENVRPNTVMNVRNNRSKTREKQRTEIVGYAFVQTLGTKDSDSSGNAASDDSDKRKGDSQKKEEDEDKAQNRSEVKDKGNSDQSNRSSGSTYTKNVVASVKDVQKRKKLYKKDADRRKVEQTKINSSSSSSHESYPAQVLLETKSKPNVEDTTNEKRDLVTQTDEKKSEPENQKEVKSSDQSTPVEGKQKTVSDKGKISFGKGIKKNVSKGSRLSIKAKESKESKSDSKRVEKSNKSKTRFSKTDKGSALSKQRKSDAAKGKPFSAFYENFFIPSKISKSILVDVDVISNGYLSLNNDSLNSNEEIGHLSETNFNILDASGHTMRHIIEQSKAVIKDDDSVSYSQPKKLAFGEAEIFSLSGEPSPQFESSTQSLTPVKKDSSNSQSVDSTGSSGKSGQASHVGKEENLKQPASVQSLNRILGVNQPDSDQSVKPSSNPIIVGPTRATDLNGSTSPKAVSIGDSAATSFVQNDAFSSKQSKEVCDDKNSGTEIVGSELTATKVRTVKKSVFPGTHKSSYLLIKNVSDSLILLSACNCAVVLGVLCAVISSTKASLSF